MSAHQLRFTVAAFLAILLLSVGGVALIITCDYQRHLDFRASLDEIAPGMRQPDELMMVAVAETRQRVGYKGTLAGGTTDANYTCDADDCTLSRFWFSVGIDPLCPVGRDEDRRQVVVYAFDLAANQVEATIYESPWNGGIDWAQMPLSFDRAAERVRASLPAGFVDRHPQYTLHLSVGQTEWLVDVSAGSGDTEELHVFRLHVDDETVEPVGV